MFNVNFEAMKDKIEKILEEHKIKGVKKDLITEELLNLHSVSHTLRELNAQIELIDDILSKGGAVTRRKLERLKDSKTKELQATIKNSCS